MFFKSIVNRVNLISFIILALLPLSFIAGRFYADLSITLIAIIFLLNINKHLFKKIFFKFLFCYFLFNFNLLYYIIFIL